jgi:hypothetical protein
LTLGNSVVAGDLAMKFKPELPGTVTRNGANFIGDVTGATGLNATGTTLASSVPTHGKVLNKKLGALSRPRYLRAG